MEFFKFHERELRRERHGNMSNKSNLYKSTERVLRPRCRSGVHRPVGRSAAPRLLRMHLMRPSSLCIEGSVGTPRAAHRRSRCLRRFAAASVPGTSDRGVSTRSLQSSFVSRSAPVDPRYRLALRSSAYILPLPPSPCSLSSSLALCTSSVGFPADASRVRHIVQSSRSLDTGTGTLTPSAEIGLRQDGGDAETGTGIELGPGLRDAWGRLSIDTRARTLLAHEHYEEWVLSGGLTVNPSASGRGLTLSIAPERGRMGSATERLWGAPDACELDGRFRARLRHRGAIRQGQRHALYGPLLGQGGHSHSTGRGTLVRRSRAVLGLEGTHERRSAGEPGTSSVMLRTEVRW